MRLRKKPWIEAAIKEFSQVINPADMQMYQGNWRKLCGFSPEAPLYLEIGIGRGRFISEMAKVHPAVLFIGLEAVVDVLYNAAQKVEENDLTNVRLMAADAVGLTEFFAPGEVDRIYLNFSDPWPKTRHAKRRLTHSLFLGRYRQILAESGVICLKTDNENLFEFSLNQFAVANMQLANITLDLHNSGAADNIMTEYEMKFSARGMRIYRCEARFR
ncbi:tRNA (guanosine(46)-N7)-methyltransferase TrmB [Acetonema longum]|uniref:tRNA (guanine-N(7)-)-methyltransferase n=1 Tax=Acetonema longum DSM 6540 TaxID=1009370 RepID=F7NL14_9FIRM|nr:tRNA (guanosine(46)-N7)-methyltransferase TrmB [Acetonema longum]EGO63270.1 tRNA (guanine-N(7)-)-methyltransferase [Acetonema longum DSM 6540]